MSGNGPEVAGPGGIMKRFIAALPPALLVSLLLHACGGGSGSPMSGSSTPTPMPSVAVTSVSGTVTGMASLVIEGTDYDESAATVSKDIDPANPLPMTVGALQIGQHVEFAVASGKLGVGHLRPRVIGPVEAVDTTGSTLTVLGQTVHVSAGMAPVTILAGGYATLASVAVGDIAEVHGTLEPDGSIAATRVEHVTQSIPGYVVVGIVDGPPTSTSFTINSQALAIGYSPATTLLPANAAITQGAAVTVFAPASGLTGTWAPGANALHLAATRIRVHDSSTLIGTGIIEAGRVRSVLPATGTPTSFRIDDDFTVDLSASPAVTTNGAPGHLADIVAGARAIVRGTVGSVGTVVASQVWIETAGSEAILLLGPVQSVDTVHHTFVVRHTTVDYASGSPQFNNGTSANLVAGAMVVVTASPSAGGIVANSITFVPLPPGYGPTDLPPEDVPSGWNWRIPTEPLLPPLGTADYFGTVSAVSTGTTTTSFTLTPGSGPAVTVNGTSGTSYAPKGMGAANLVAGATVLVSGLPNASGAIDASLIVILGD